MLIDFIINNKESLEPIIKELYKFGFALTGLFLPYLLRSFYLSIRKGGPTT